MRFYKLLIRSRHIKALSAIKVERVPLSRTASQHRRRDDVSAVALIGHQIAVHQPLPNHTASERCHLIDGIEIADIVAARELHHVPAQVILAHVMKRAVIAPFQQSPEALDPVGVGHVAHILSDAVAHALMLERYPLIGRCVVRAHGVAPVAAWRTTKPCNVALSVS